MKKQIWIILKLLIKRTYSKMLVIAIVASIGISIFVGLQNTYNILKNTVDTYKKECGTGDVFISTVLLNSEQSSYYFLNLNGTTTEKRYTKDAKLFTKEGTDFTVRIVGVENFSSVVPKVYQGRLPKGQGELAFSYKFNDNKTFTLGETVTLQTPLKNVNFNIIGTYYTPEYMSIFRTPYSLFDTSEFRYVMMDIHEMWNLFGEGEVYNEFMLSVDNNINKETVLKDVQKKLGKYIKYGMKTDDMPNYINLDSNLHILKNTIFVPLILYGVSIVFIYLSLAQLIIQNRTEIGLLRALGYTKSKILIIYIMYSLTITLIAAFLGSIGGIFLGAYISGIFKVTFNLPSLVYSLSWNVVFLTIIISIVSGILTGLTISKHISNIHPSEAMKKSLPKSVKFPILISYLIGFTKGITKSCLVMMFRHTGRFLLTIVCIIACIIMLLMSFIFLDSKNELLSEMFGSRMKYDVEINFNNFIDKNQQEKWLTSDKITECEPILSTSVMFTKGDISKIGLLSGIEQENKMITLHNSSKETLKVKQGEIILDQSFAEDLSASVGDTITVEYGKPNGESISTEVRIGSISKQYSMKTQYCTIEMANIITGNKTSMTGIISNFIGEEKALKKYAKQFSYFDYLSFKKNKLDEVQSSLGSVSVCSYILILCAISMGFLILYNINLINFSARKREYTIFRMLGCTIMSVSINSMLEILIQFAISILFGIPLGLYLGKLYISKLSTGIMNYPEIVTDKTILLCVLITFIYMILSHIVAMLKLKHLDLTEVMKER